MLIGIDPLRQHYRNDLKPFPCLSQDCRDSRPSFTSRTEWLNHMKSAHSGAWSQEIHRQPMWVCNNNRHNDRDYNNKAVYMFSTPSDLHNHILLQHEYNAISPDDAEIWELVRRSEVNGIPPLALCPLCSFLEGNTIEAKHGIPPLVNEDSGKGKEQLSP